MGHQTTATLMRSVRESIERLTTASAAAIEDRAVMRALAHLWSAYDELEMSARANLGRPNCPRRVCESPDPARKPCASDG